MTERYCEGERFADLSFTEEAFEAVSYTHLRAHETVLDLVCRLLLENKTSIRLYTASSFYKHE